MKIASIFTVVALITAATPGAFGQESEAGKKLESTPTSVETAKSEAAKSETQKADTEVDGVTAELLSVARTDGDTITVKFKYSNGSQKSANVYPTGYSPDNLAAKLYYIDPKNKKKYSVIKDTAGEFLCSNMKSVTLEAGASKSGWSKLPAPPADVTNITVFLPGTPPFEGVKIAP
jgi:hypothetical protein